MKAKMAIAGGVIITVAGACAVWFFSTTSVHPDPNAVPFTTGVHTRQYSDAIEKGRRLAREMVLEENLPGISVAVGIGPALSERRESKGDIVWAEGVGWADVERHEAVTQDTRFRLGTASTMLTSAAVGVLVENDRLRLDNPIQAYVPEFPKTRWPVTLRQLMAHTAGVTSDSGDEGPLFRQRCERPVEALPHFADRELLFEPGTQRRYSKYGWVLVSAAVEAAANQPFLTFMREQIFQPLRMDGTGAESATEENPEHIGEPAEDFPLFALIRELILEPLGFGAMARSAVPNMAAFYFPRVAADPRYGLHEMRPHNLSCYAGSMAFFSTPSDLVRFGLAIDAGKLLQPDTVKVLETLQPLGSVDGESLGGAVASVKMLRERGIVVAVMSNISYANTPSLALTIAEAFAEQQRP